MAKDSNHSTFSIFAAVVYAAVGYLLLGVEVEHVLLASVIIFIAGVLPDIDTDREKTGQEVGALLAAVSPLLAFEYFPQLKVGGIARVALVVICCYILTRLVFSRLLKALTSYRGIIHSVPAAIITFELTYLLFWDLFWFERLYISTAAFVGYFSHLILDAYGNMHLLSRAVGKEEKEAPALKFKGGSKGSTLAAYSIMFGLGYFVFNDLYPVIRHNF